MNDEMTESRAGNPFSAGTQAAIMPSGVAASSEREKQEVMAQILLAKRFPRNQVESMDRILNSCSRATLAETALYSYSKGGAEITGPSIRLAEAMALAWGNLQFGVRELETLDGESKVEAFAWDMETNTRVVKVFTVKHERHSRAGATKLTDPRDIYETVANNGSRRVRACILAIIPGDVIEAAENQCELTLKSKISITPDSIKAMCDAFKALGVSQAMIEERIQRRVDTITPAQMVGLRKVYASLKDGMGVVGDWFKGKPGASAGATDPTDADPTRGIKSTAAAAAPTTTSEADK